MTSKIRVYEVNGRWGHAWSVSEDEVYLPGSYESEDAARYAPRLRAATLQCLQDRVNAANEDATKRVITMEMMKAASPRTIGDYEVRVDFGPAYASGHDEGYNVYISDDEISEGGLIAFSPEKADVLADLDLLIARLGEARRRLEELP